MLLEKPFKCEISFKGDKGIRIRQEKPKTFDLRTYKNFKDTIEIFRIFDSEGYFLKSPRSNLQRQWLSKRRSWKNGSESGSGAPKIEGALRRCFSVSSPVLGGYFFSIVWIEQLASLFGFSFDGFGRQQLSPFVPLSLPRRPISIQGSQQKRKIGRQNTGVKMTK